MDTRPALALRLVMIFAATATLGSAAIACGSTPGDAGSTARTEPTTSDASGATTDDVDGATTEADLPAEDALPDAPKDAGVGASGSCAPLPPGVYVVKMTRMAGTAIACFPYAEQTIDLTPEGLADASSMPAQPVDAGTCVQLPAPACTFKLDCDLSDGSKIIQTLIETRDPATGKGTTRWTAVESNGDVLFDCTWLVSWTKL